MSLVSALLVAMMAVTGLVLLIAGRSPVPWSSWRLAERHWVRAYGGVLVLLATALTARMALDAVAATYVLLGAAFVPPLLAAFEDNRRARRP